MRRRRILLNAQAKTPSIDGGPFAAAAGPPAWPLPDDDVREQLLAAYESGAWGQYHGPYVARLEALIAERHGVPLALACSSGTIAVELALRGLNVGPGDEVILAGYDFSGNFRAIEATGARPVLVDLAPQSWSLDPQEIQAAIGPSTKAILASHLHSSIAPMRQLTAIARERGIAVVEDACQAQGATVEGRLAGTWGDVGVWSFGGSKLLTAGRGGAVFTADEQVHQRMKIYCERGNHAFAISELQAAVLLPQIAKLDRRNQQRQASAAELYRHTRDIDCLIAPAASASNCRPAYYKVSWFYQPSAPAHPPREMAIKALRAGGVGIDGGFRGFTRRPASRCRKVGRLPHSQRAAEATLVLHHPVLLAPPERIQHVGEVLRQMAEAMAEDKPRD